LYVNPDIFGFWKTFPIFLLGLFGIWVSILGFEVVRREGEYFFKARIKHIIVARSLGLDTAVFLMLANGKKVKFDDLEIKFDDLENTSDSSKEKVDWNKEANQLCKPGIRTFFQWNFIATGVIFILISVLFSAISLGTCFAHVHGSIR